MTNRFCLWVVLFILVSNLHGQQDPLKKANEAFEAEKYREALIYYNRIEKLSTSAPLLYKRGICYYEINQLDLATGDFQRAWEYGYENTGIDYYNGLISHQRGNFSQAASLYKKYLNDLDADSARRKEVIRLIKQCGRAIDLLYRRPLAVVEKLPSQLNSAYDEIGLIESPTQEGKFYFTSNKPNLSTSLDASDYDVYWITENQGEWSEAERMRYTINKRDHEILLGFTPLADGLYFYRGKDSHGDIFQNMGSGNKSRTKALVLPTALSIVNSDAYFFDDHVILFSSNSKGGHGGYDLYASILENGKWSEPKNLGPKINSAFDEVSPYLSYDGSELYFSSNKNESIGGYDIFYSRFLYEANEWEQPSNLGIPINSPGDEIHFSLSFDGLRGMFSSDRKSSFGGQDIFIARFKEVRGTQGYGTQELAFLNYKIPNRIGEEVTQNLETDLSNTTPISNSDNRIEKVTVSDTAIKDTLSTNSFEMAKTKTPVIRTPKEMAVKLDYSPIFYNSGADLITGDNYQNVEKIILAMKQDPNLEVEFVSHAGEEGILEYRLFSSLKIAERLEKYFTERGISDSRIQIKGFADNYPIARTEKNGGDYKYADKYNSRIELRFSNYDKSLLSLVRQEPDIPSYTKDLKHELYSTLIEDAVTYKVQIAMVSQMYRGMALDLFNDAIVEEIEKTGLYAYSIGLYDNYSEALAVKRDMDQLGITDAQVVAYYNGKRLSADEYVYYVNDFPDLRNLMNYSE